MARNTLISSLAALAVFAATDIASGQDGGDAPFRVGAGVFDLTVPKTLGLTAISGTHVDVHRASTEDGFLFSHHPSIAVFEGRLYCSWSSGRAHEDRPGQRVLISSSEDGRVWSPPAVLAEPPKGGSGACIAAGFHVHGGTLTAYHTIRNDYPMHALYNSKNALYAQSSTDGSTWGSARRIVSGFFIEGPRPLPGGRLLLGGEHVGEAWKSHKARMRLLYSDSPDGVSGWEAARIDPAGAKPKGLMVFGYTEPCPFVRGDGLIVCPFRNDSGFLYASLSRDKGRSWSVPQRTNFPDSMARCSTGRLPRGAVYLINNPAAGAPARSPLTIALSDDGVLFDRAWTIRGEPTAQRFKGKGKRDGWQYPNALVWRESLFVVYSVNKEDIMLTRIPLEELR